MSCESIVARDFMNNFENSNVGESRKGSLSSSSSESGHAYTEEMRSLDLFRERHLLKVQHLIQKSGKGDSRKTRKARFFVPLDGGGCSRPPTRLEQHLLPAIKSNDPFQPLASDQSEGAQMTIFYDGVINVYDNVSTDKAKAIMLLAGESSLKVPATTKTVAEQDTTVIRRETYPKSECKLQANLPITSRRSLIAFFDKRRDRIMNSSPYATPTQIKLEAD